MATHFAMCPTCRRVFFVISRATAMAEIARMTEYLLRLPDSARQRDYGERVPMLERY